MVASQVLFRWQTVTQICVCAALVSFWLPEVTSGWRNLKKVVAEICDLMHNYFACPSSYPRTGGYGPSYFLR